jgi:hypothetical protein
MYQAASRKQYTKPVGKYLRKDCAELTLSPPRLLLFSSSGRKSLIAFSKKHQQIFSQRKQKQSRRGSGVERKTFKRKRSLVLGAIVSGSVSFRLVGC